MGAGAGLAQAVELKGVSAGAPSASAAWRGSSRRPKPGTAHGPDEPDASMTPAIERDHGKRTPKTAQAAASMRHALAVVTICSGRS
jgi:hypothetical protein